MTTITVKERPILFNGEMVRAILDGRKTQTRRVVKPRFGKNPDVLCGGDIRTGVDHPFEQYGAGGVWLELRCPYGKPGDRLWVRETWKPWMRSCSNGIEYRAGGQHKTTLGEDFEQLKSLMKKTGGDLKYKYGDWGDPHPDEVRYRTDWRPSIHMPRWASRITLEVTDVRVERVQDISEEDALAEGMIFPSPAESVLTPQGLKTPTLKYYFKELWDSINAKRGYGWDVNPWVWIITFKRVEGGGDVTNEDNPC